MVNESIEASARGGACVEDSAGMDADQVRMSLPGAKIGWLEEALRNRYPESRHCRTVFERVLIW